MAAMEVLELSMDCNGNGSLGLEGAAVVMTSYVESWPGRVNRFGERSG
jgi:hypothetical protein